MSFDENRAPIWQEKQQTMEIIAMNKDHEYDLNVTREPLQLLVADVGLTFN